MEEHLMCAVVFPGRALCCEEEKPLRATVSFSIEHARPLDAYIKTSNGVTSSCFTGNTSKGIKYPTTRQQPKLQQNNIRFNKQNDNFVSASHFFVRNILWHYLHKCNVKMPNLEFYG